MSDDLRTRISAAVEAHDPAYLPGGLDCNCGQGFRSDAQWVAASVELRRLWSDHVADAVIAELGLHREELSEVGSSVLFDDPRPHHRYVTDWIADG